MVTMASNPLELLANSWSAASSGYNDVFVPRFSPWTNDVLEVVANETPKNDHFKNNPTRCHRCCVPCCGPGQELLPLADILGPSWSILGVDLAPGMIHVAKQRLSNINKQPPSIDAVVGDCSEELPGQPYNLIVSIFGFQQMSDPLSVLQVWFDSLDEENGALVVCFWPSGIEDFETPSSEEASPRPFSRFRQVVQQRLANENNGSKKEDDKKKDVASWDDQVLQKANELGTVVQDRYICHDIQWESVDQFWDAMTRSGPWHAMRLKRGDEFVDGLKDDVCAVFGGDGPVTHQARARLLVLRRTRTNGCRACRGSDKRDRQ